MLETRNAVFEADTPLERAIEQADVSVFITDLEGRIQYVNETFEQTTGYSRADVMGQTPRILRSDEHSSDFYRDLWETIQCGEVWKGRITNRRKDGVLIHDRTTISPVKDETGTVVNYVAVASDVSKEAELEIQLRQAQKMEAIGQLASGIAHEINTPTQYIGDNIRFFRDSFSGIAGLLHKYEAFFAAVEAGRPIEKMADEIRKETKEVDLEFLLKETPGAVERTIEGNLRVAEVVRAMKEFAYPSSEEMTKTDINRAIETTISVARNEWKYVAEVETDLDPELPLVSCVPGGLNQVVLNLLVNAAHAIQDVVEEGSSEKGTIRVSTRHEGAFAIIEISDTGCGIPKEKLSRIYDPFFTTKEMGRGTGQGLAIAHSAIVDTHGGTIDCSSVEGKGTTFIIRLPIDQEDNDQILSQAMTYRR